MVDPREPDHERPPWPFEGSARRGELLAYKLHLDARIRLRRIYRLRPTNHSFWLFHGKPMRLIEIRPAAYCYRMKFDLTPDEITDPSDERCRCVYTDNWQPAALALTLVPTESARRMMHMLALCGANPGLASDDDSRSDPVLEHARKRCRDCPVEEICDEWLAGRAKGDDSFCPNAPAFRRLAERADEKRQK